MEKEILPGAADILEKAGQVKAPVIVIEGMCGGGKTTLANALAAMSGAPVIRMDDFFLPFPMRTQERLAQPGGNVHYERFEEEVLPFVGQQAAFSYRRFHCGEGNFSPVACPANKLRIVEGSYSMHPRFMPAWDQMGAVTVFVSVSAGEQLRRIEKRNPELLERFRNIWIPMENQYFSAYQTKEKASIQWKIQI